MVVCTRRTDRVINQLYTKTYLHSIRVLQTR